MGGLLKKGKKVLQDPVGRIAGSVFGKKTFASLDPGGQILGQYDSLYKPEDVQAPASPIVDAEAYQQRDRIRRIARRAQGRDSTIRTNLTAPATGQPATLLGS